jgi:type II secretory pathway component PulJ
MIGLDILIAILAALAGGAGGCLLTIDHYHQAAQRRTAAEQEVSQAWDLLAARALLRRVRADRRPDPGQREQ